MEDKMKNLTPGESGLLFLAGLWFLLPAYMAFCNAMAWVGGQIYHLHMWVLMNIGVLNLLMLLAVLPYLLGIVFALGIIILLNY